MLQAHVRGSGGAGIKQLPGGSGARLLNRWEESQRRLEAGCRSERGGQIPQCALLILDAGVSSHRKGSSL